MATAIATPLASPEQVLRMVGRAGLLALDLETTGLDPGADRVRLVSLCDGRQTVVLDCFEHPGALPALCAALKGKLLVAHNAAFDLSFLWQAGLHDPPETVCTYLLACLLTAGERFGFAGCGLADCCARWTGTLLPKDLQASDWSGALSAEQVQYAARDAEVLPPLLRRLEEEIRKAGLEKVADLELRALPAFVRLRCAGVSFDRERWEALARKAAGEVRRLGDRLEAEGPPKGSVGLFGHHERWNWNSPDQVATAFAQLGEPLGVDYKGRTHSTTNDAALALCRHPLAAVLRDHRHQAQLVKMYGANWLAAATIRGGRLYPDWRQLGTVTGRTSCSQPNVQQIPRDEEAGKVVYRTCFAAPPGRVLVKADYATLQMRIACKWAKDRALYDVFARDGDPHTATAKALLGKETVTKADRQIAKSANFALLFGAGAEGLRVYAKTTFGIDLSPEEAKRHRTRFFERYNGLARWHNDTRRDKVKETRCTSGRRRLLNVHTPDTERLSSPVQGDEACGSKTAMALLWERRTEHPEAVPVLFCHDEICLEAPEEGAEEIRLWLEEAMMDAMGPILDPVPCKVDSKIVPSWGG